MQSPQPPPPPRQPQPQPQQRSPLVVYCFKLGCRPLLVLLCNTTTATNTTHVKDNVCMPGLPAMSNEKTENWPSSTINAGVHATHTNKMTNTVEPLRIRFCHGDMGVGGIKQQDWFFFLFMRSRFMRSRMGGGHVGRDCGNWCIVFKRWRLSIGKLILFRRHGHFKSAQSRDFLS